MSEDWIYPAVEWLERKNKRYQDHRLGSGGQSGEHPRFPTAPPQNFP